MIWFAAASFILCLIFLIRALRGQTIAMVAVYFLLFLSYAYLGVFFLPFGLPPKMHQILREGLVTLAALFIILEAIYRGAKWVSKIEWLRFRLPLRLPEYLWEVIRAMEQLALLRRGALIVLERKDSLEAYSKNAVLFDSEVNKDVLISIFHTASPLHDGALLIRKGRLRAARMILPLATNPEVPMGLGTRHRSGIGITEKTDAIALIVSEERGQMSLAYRGSLVKGESAEKLADYLDLVLKGKDPLSRKKITLQKS